MALSQSLRDILPFRVLSKETLKGLGLNNKKLKVVSQSSLSEENDGYIVVASSPDLNPTSKFIAVRYHWFRLHIESDRNGYKPISI